MQINKIMHAKKLPLRLFFCFLGIIVLFCMLPAAPATAAETDDEKLSLYQVSLAINEYYSDATKPQEGKVSKGVQAINGNILPGNAGAFVGYGEKGWFASAMSNSSSTATYDSFSNVTVAGGGKTSNIAEYCRYGYVLGGLGLDKTTVESAFSAGSMITGSILFLLYAACLAIPTFFSAIIKILKTFNPFALFGLSGIDLGSISGGFINVDSNSPVFAVAQEISKLYKNLYDLSWTVVVPLFFAILVFMLLLFKRLDKSSKIKKYIIRIAFIVLGVPILGTMYTNTIDNMGNFNSFGNSAATRVVASTFCDFETWATNMRLAPPDGAVIAYVSTNIDNAASATPSMAAMLGVRASCYAINAASGAVANLPAGGSPFAAATDAAGIAKWDTTATKDNTGTDTTAAAAGDMFNMIDRYMRGDFYFGSDYESKIKAELSAATSADSDTSDKIYKMFDNASKKDSWTGDFGKTVFTAGDYNIFANGGLTSTITANGDRTGKSDGNRFTDTSTKNDIKISDIQGLSTISMFNYLNTSFNGSNVVTYSSEKASSGFVRKSHRSVTLVGSGLTAFLYWLNSIMLLGSFAVIGYFYGFTIIFANIKRSMLLIMEMPFAMLGALRSIAKVLTYTAVLIIEIVLTIFLYGLVTEILMALPNAVQAPIAAALSSSTILNDSFTGNLANILIPLMLVISCIIYGIFVVQALKLRKMIVKSVDEAAADIVNKFLDVKGVNERPTPNMGSNNGSGNQKQVSGNTPDNTKIKGVNPGSGKTQKGDIKGVSGTKTDKKDGKDGKDKDNKDKTDGKDTAEKTDNKNSKDNKDKTDGKDKNSPSTPVAGAAVNVNAENPGTENNTQNNLDYEDNNQIEAGEQTREDMELAAAMLDSKDGITATTKPVEPDNSQPEQKKTKATEDNKKEDPDKTKNTDNPVKTIKIDTEKPGLQAVSGNKDTAEITDKPEQTKNAVAADPAVAGKTEITDPIGGEKQVLTKNAVKPGKNNPETAEKKSRETGSKNRKQEPNKVSSPGQPTAMAGTMGAGSAWLEQSTSTTTTAATTTQKIAVQGQPGTGNQTENSTENKKEEEQTPEKRITRPDPEQNNRRQLGNRQTENNHKLAEKEEKAEIKGRTVTGNKQPEPEKTAPAPTKKAKANRFIQQNVQHGQTIDRSPAAIAAGVQMGVSRTVQGITDGKSRTGREIKSKKLAEKTDKEI